MQRRMRSRRPRPRITNPKPEIPSKNSKNQKWKVARSDATSKRPGPQIPNPKSQVPKKRPNPTAKWKTARNHAILKIEHFDSRNRRERLSNLYREPLAMPRDVRQLVCASGSAAAKWIEADEELSKKDFLMCVKIRCKEVKESRLFLRAVDAGLTKSNTAARDILSTEARELV